MRSFCPPINLSTNAAIQIRSNQTKLETAQVNLVKCSQMISPDPPQIGNRKKRLKNYMSFFLGGQFHDEIII